MKRVLLVGCGNIGFRHLQAMAQMEAPSDIVVVEPNDTHHDRIVAEFAGSTASPHRFSLAGSLPDADHRVDLVVVATAAMHRRDVIEDVLNRFDVAAMLLEKVLFQTTGDVAAVGDLFRARDVRAFVNCGRRSFAGYQLLRERLTDRRPVSIEVDGSRLGLASNAIHFLDLAEFVNDSEIVAVDARGLEPGSVPARHPGCVDVFGTITASLANGAELSVTSSDTDPMTINVSMPGVDVDELARTVRWGTDEPEAFGSQNVSETPWIYDELIDQRTCILTPYAASARQHHLFLDALRTHLDLSVDDDAPCPIS